MIKKLVLATAFIRLLTPAAFAMSDEECTVLSKRSDVYASGKLTPAYTAAMTKSGRTIPADGTIDQAMFMEACKADAFKTAATTPDAGAPFTGANSFTEAQAMDRIGKAGFKDVTGLAKDSNGIWRGTAMQGGKPVPVSLDFKGNVVSN